MKTISTQVRLSLFALGVLLTAGTALAVNDTVPPNAVSASGVRVTTKDEYQDFGFHKLRGTGVRGADGKQLGSVRDLILDARTGEPKFVVVTGGGFVGIGSDARILPFEALIREPKQRDFLTRLQRVDWELLPTIEKADIDEGRLVLTSDNRRNVARLREQRWAQAFETLGTPEDNAGSGRYVFASALVGKPLHGDGEKVGEVEDLFLDTRGGPALAVVDIDQDYIGAHHRYVVPLQSLQVAAGKNGRVHTTLAAADFRDAAGVRMDTAPGVPREEGRWVRVRDHKEEPRRESHAVVEPRERPVEATPAPTGFPSSYRANETVNAPTLDTAAQTIRERWNADPALRRQNLRVVTERGHIVLDGVTTTARLAEQAADTARRVTSGIEVENRIRVETGVR